MRKPSHVVEIFLNPGEFYFAGPDTRIRTILGSCVSITMWHPKLVVGGMCHYMLPERGATQKMAPDGKYADEAFNLLIVEAQKIGAPLHEFRLKMFGGGNMFPGRDVPIAQRVGERNIEAGHSLMRHHAMRCDASDVGGFGHRSVLFDIWSGHVWVRQFNASLPEQCNSCETKSSCMA